MFFQKIFFSHKQPKDKKEKYKIPASAHAGIFPARFYQFFFSKGLQNQNTSSDHWKIRIINFPVDFLIGPGFFLIGERVEKLPGVLLKGELQMWE